MNLLFRGPSAGLLFILANLSAYTLTVGALQCTNTFGRSGSSVLCGDGTQELACQLASCHLPGASGSNSLKDLIFTQCTVGSQSNVELLAFSFYTELDPRHIVVSAGQLRNPSGDFPAGGVSCPISNTVRPICDVCK
ncbi:hypothetical protein O181_033849 [Austropuccinia psidii MF-1]|uniref:Cyanovirin-N domain-containing protein n=1 Tax=Austropuccinia psidii MF-1 TaxID=1389203 RepID=A0A9Q3CZV2_9BASI|nr:hypothetical protein [Austropuccinia psidii MF-1]